MLDRRHLATQPGCLSTRRCHLLLRGRCCGLCGVALRRCRCCGGFCFSDAQLRNTNLLVGLLLSLRCMTGAWSRNKEGRMPLER
jgi:hypothetical protein